MEKLWEAIADVSCGLAFGVRSLAVPVVAAFWCGKARTVVKGMSRAGEKLGSAELPTRLATGSLVRQKDRITFCLLWPWKELKGERLCFELLGGDGPNKGWVSLKLKAWKS